MLLITGAVPYQEIKDNQLVLHYLRSGRRLQRPEICTHELFQIMQRCWRRNPQERPSFDELVHQLSNNNRRIYVAFARISSNYVFPPARIRN